MTINTTSTRARKTAAWVWLIASIVMVVPRCNRSVVQAFSTVSPRYSLVRRRVSAEVMDEACRRRNSRCCGQRLTASTTKLFISDGDPVDVVRIPPPLSSKSEWSLQRLPNMFASVAAGAFLASMAVLFSFSDSALAENELSAKYGGGGFDSSLVDQTCLVNHCSLQAKACLADDPSCRKGLTCTAKCLGDNACITGCMARYGNENLDNLLKCTIEDHECIKVAILEGGNDAYGQEPRAPAPTVPNFDYRSLQGTWYKVVGYNPNYDCYACQRNTFALPTASPHVQASNDHDIPPNNQDYLLMDVEFSMPHLMPDGSPPPPSNVRESIQLTNDESVLFGSQSIGLNDYNTHEMMIFDTPASLALQTSASLPASSSSLPSSYNLMLRNPNTNIEMIYARTAHSEGEMFGLKFWENWYVLGENDPGMPEFKFIYYNGKTRQNTYEGAFVYSRTRELSPSNMEKVYQIAQNAGMNPKQFCKIRNGCFGSDPQIIEPLRDGPSSSEAGPLFLRGILASTKISQLLGIEPVKAEDEWMTSMTATAQVLTPFRSTVEDETSTESNNINSNMNHREDSKGATVLADVSQQRSWWHEVGDYLENPHRHFQAMDQLRVPVDWPEELMERFSTAVAKTSTPTTSSSSSSSTTSTITAVQESPTTTMARN